MTRTLAALAAGTLFGVGLALSRMTSPARVLAFLDVSGAFDPSLALVMGGAAATATLVYAQVLRRARPLFAERFDLPSKRGIDARLLAGAALFGVGWGLGGFCPGSALAALAFGHAETVQFVAAMLLGMGIMRGR